MKVVGLIGGIASGKSTVAEWFAKRGAEVIDADRLGHEVLDRKDVIHAFVGRWGDDILDPSGTINRSAVAKRVFAKGADSERAFLNLVTHPLIRRLTHQRLEELRSQGACPVAVIDAALLLEAGWNQECDHVVFIDAPDSMRLERAKSRGWNMDELANREASQWPLKKKRELATMVIDNSRDLAFLNQQLESVWNALVK